MSLSATVHYRAIEEHIPLRKVEDRRVPSTELFSGRVKGKLVKLAGDGAMLEFEEGSINLEYSDGGLGWIRNISVPLKGLTLSLLEPILDGGSQFKLKVQPIGFRVGMDDPKPTGARWKSQLDQATVVWQGCGIELDVKEISFLESEDRKTNPEPEIVRGSRDPEVATVEVYFSSAEMADGGGVALSCGTALSAIVVSDLQTDKVNLVAHEIGHILCGIHPTAPKERGMWQGEFGSVMESVDHITTLQPLGSASCSHAKNAALEVMKPQV